jgi:CRISPR system Cascade subunit CasD
MRYLLFQLYGLMSAWGSPGAGTIRKTDDHPSKSGVLGMVAACLGIEPDKEEELAILQNSIGYGCREDIPGNLLVDFHTVRPESSTSMVAYWDKIREGLPTDVKEDNLILSYRHYLTGALFTICLWEETEGIGLDKIAEALSKPVFTPYLGRKCCVLCLPLGQTIVTAKNLKEAFSQFMPDSSYALRDDRFSANPRAFWEGPDKSIPVVAQHTRKDCLKNRRTWAYTRRVELEGILEGSKRCITKQS